MKAAAALSHPQNTVRREIEKKEQAGAQIQTPPHPELPLLHTIYVIILCKTSTSTNDINTKIDAGFLSLQSVWGSNARNQEQKMENLIWRLNAAVAATGFRISELAIFMYCESFVFIVVKIINWIFAGCFKNNWIAQIHECFLHTKK